MFAPSNRAAMIGDAIAKHQKQSAKHFKSLYGATRGIIKIEPFKDTVVVFYDRDLFKENLPFEFGGIHILPYDVKKVLNDSQKLLTSIGKKKVASLSKKDVKTHRLLIRTIELCEGLLK